MNAKQQAAEDLKKLSSMFRGIVALGDDLNALGSIEQATAEAESKLAMVQAQVREAQSQRDSHVAGVTDAKQMAESIAQVANDKAAQMLRDASAQTDRIIQAAHASADTITAAAQAKQNALVADGALTVEGARTTAASIIAAAKSRADEMDATIQAHSATLASIASDIQSRTAQLDALNSRLDQIKQHLASIG